MQEQQSRRVPTSVVAGIAAVVVLGGGATAWWISNSKTAPKATNPISTVTPAQTPAAIEIPVTPPPSTSTAQTLKPVQPATQQGIPQVFWLKDAGTSTELVPKPLALNKSEKPNESLQTAFNTLLSNPAEPGTFSTIPQGTKLRSLEVKNDGIYIDLSPEFKSGGGSATMIGRLAQVLYTATSIDANAKVWISVNGERLEVLGGEGLQIPQPLTRQTFQKEFSL